MRDYFSRFPTNVIAPAPNAHLGGWLHDLVPMAGITFVFQEPAFPAVRPVAPYCTVIPSAPGTSISNQQLFGKLLRGTLDQGALLSASVQPFLPLELRDYLGIN